MAKKKLAVCAGLNYPGTDAALAGCINDANDWAAALVERGYEVRKLYEPTKAELLAELKAMVARSSYGDRLAFTYSGHGSWVPDRDGDEPDGRDEVLVCKDYRAGGLLTDDELHQVFTQTPWGVRKFIFSDSCHSGTVSRFAAAPLRSLNTPEDEILTRGRFRFLAPSVFLEESDLARAYQAEKLPARGVPRSGAVLISGCGDLEYSYDATFDGRPNGAATYFALKQLPLAKNVVGWHRGIRAYLPNNAHPQTPQLTARPHQRYWSPL